MKLEEKLLLENRAWAKDKTLGDPDYFERLARGQSPKILWIGCSDSRIPAEDITNSGPGDIFVHRNIANQVDLDDPNVSSVIEYAVTVLKVDHVIVCGHHECGGMRAALSKTRLSGHLESWLAKIRAHSKKSVAELREIEDEQAAANQLSERNVVQQVRTLLEYDCVVRAKEERNLTVHGWMFNMSTGLLQELIKA